jgi:tryptophanyl-tRNA synthetase
MSNSAKVVFSGIQPTGKLHLGRYFGAVQNWKQLQSQYDCIYCIVDYHAMTMPYDPVKLRENVWNLAIDLIACGIETKNLFIQSMVPEHTELCWILNCMCSYGELSRMTQFKDKTQQLKEKAKDDFISSALFVYPVLQAADILIYKTNYVPVGKDQEQHLELSRNIATRFNYVTGKEYFPLPETLFTETPKIMSTADPLRKMSASAGDKHFIDVFAPVDVIRKQIRSAVTDTGEINPTNISPGITNLLNLISACNPSIEIDIAARNMYLLEKFNGNYSGLKNAVADAVIETVSPLQKRRSELLADKKAIKDEIKKSAANIRERAKQTVNEVRQLTGLG